MEHSNIEQTAIHTYNENLLFLQATQPDLFEKISALSHAIDKGFYKEKYSLEYKEDYFDVLEVETGNWLYGVSSVEHAKVSAKSVNLTKTDNVYETFYNVKISKEYAQELEQLSIAENSASGAARLISYANEYADKSVTSMKKLYKFIFLGTGLGLHISAIHEKIHSNIYFIIEDDLELFRLSLFVTNYKNLTLNGAQLIFSVFDDEEEFANHTRMFLNEHFIYNHFIKFFHLLSHSEKKLKTIQGIIVGQNYLTFNYSALTTSLLRPLTHLKNGYRLLDIGSSYKGTLFSHKPVLILGAGPSFQKNTQWLKENYHKFILVAVTPLLAKLEELNIKPDIITHVHGFSDALPHVQKVKDISFFDESICLFGGFTQPEFLQYFKKENVFIFEGTSRYKHGHSGITSSNIGSITLGLFLMLATKDMYLLGLDFAMDQESGQTHSDTHNYTRKVELQENEKIGGEMIYKQEVIKVKGNFKEEVFTTLLFNGWRDECHAIANTYRTFENENIYNLSDGAYINNSIPMKLDDTHIQSLPQIDKHKLHQELQSLFISKSADYLTEAELYDLKLRLNYCNEIIDILEKHANTNHQNIDTYHYNLLGVFYNILTEEGDVASSDLNYVITLYLQLVSGYIFDLINTKEITNHKKLIKHLDRVVIPQIIRVISYFKDNIQEYLDYAEEKKQLSN